MNVSEDKHWFHLLCVVRNIPKHSISWTHGPDLFLQRLHFHTFIKHIFQAVRRYSKFCYVWKMNKVFIETRLQYSLWNIQLYRDNQMQTLLNVDWLEMTTESILFCCVQGDILLFGRRLFMANNTKTRTVLVLFSSIVTLTSWRVTTCHYWPVSLTLKAVPGEKRFHIWKFANKPQCLFQNNC